MKNSIVSLQKSFFIVCFLTILVFKANAGEVSMSLKDEPGIVLSDDLKSVKIKGPSVRMYKKADLEIHHNMYDELRAVVEIKLDPREIVIADWKMNQLFIENNILFNESISFEVADHVINELFFKEQ